MELQLLLKQLPLFQPLTDHEIRELAGKSYIFHRHQEGEVIVRQGELGHSFFILLKGRVSVAFDDQFFLKLRPGAVFGEVAFIAKSAMRISSVVCGENGSITMEVDEGTYKKFNPTVREKIWDIMLQLMVRKLSLMNQEYITMQKLFLLLSANQVDDPEDVDDGWGCPNSYQQCRRQRKRFLFDIPVYLDLLDGRVLSGQLKNFSTSGAFITTATPHFLHANQLATLGLARHQSLHVDRQIIYPCTIAWVEGEGFGIRWQFTPAMAAMENAETNPDS